MMKIGGPDAERARSWLQVNCSHCHREGAGGSVVTHFDYETSLVEMKAVGRQPSQGTFGLTDAHVITAGDPCSSVLYYRISTTGQGRMPLIGSTQVDLRGSKLLYDWIRQLPGEAPEAPPPSDFAGSAGEAAALRRIWDPSAGSSEVNTVLDRLLSTPNRALALANAIKQRSDDHHCPPALIEKISRHPSFQVHDLFDRFLPDDLRPKKLGLNIRPEQILTLAGDVERCRKVFRREDVQCSRCHRVRGEGRDFGPDLSQIGRKYPKGELLDQILDPSKIIDPAFTLYQVETRDDHSYSGFIVKRTAEELVLKDVELNEVRIPADSLLQVPGAAKTLGHAGGPAPEPDGARSGGRARIPQSATVSLDFIQVEQSEAGEENLLPPGEKPGAQEILQLHGRG